MGLGEEIFVTITGSRVDLSCKEEREFSQIQSGVFFLRSTFSLVNFLTRPAFWWISGVDQ